MLGRIYNQIIASVTPITQEGGWGRGKIVLGTIVSAGMFGAIQTVAKRVLSKLRENKVIEMNERHHEQSPSYVASTAHALGITCWAISKILSSNNGGECRNIIPFTLGYFINDFFQECVLHQQTDLATITHHASTIALLSSGLQSPTDVAIFLPHVYTVEISTIFLNSTWFLRSLGMTSHQLFKPSMITFALSFFAFRVAYLPFVMFKVFTLEQFTGPRKWFGWRIHGMHLLILLNFFWFGKLMKKMIC